MQNSHIISAVGWIVGLVGGLVGLCGFLAWYIFTRHVRDDDQRYNENRSEHKEIFDRLRNGNL